MMIHGGYHENFRFGFSLSGVALDLYLGWYSVLVLWSRA